MKSRGNKILFRWVIILIGSFLLIWVVKLSLTAYLEREIHEKLYSSKVKVSSIQVNLISRSVLVKNLEWDSTPDSLNSDPHIIEVSKLSFKGIGLYQLLVNKTLIINEVVLDSGKLQYNKSTIRYIRKAIISKYNSFTFNTIYFNNIEMKVMTDTVVTFSAFLDLHLIDACVTLDSVNVAHYSLQNSDGIIRDMNFSRHEGMYGGTIKQISFNALDKSMTIDSVLLIPNFSKFKFARYLGEQKGRVNISIPKLTLEGVAFDKLIDSTLAVAKIVVQSFDLYSFKDKRVPFLNKDAIPLPMEGFLSLSWRVKIDSILISKSRIIIEEFPAKGNERTLITFDDVNATLSGLNNRPGKKEQYAILHANGLLLNTGRVHVAFQFPLDGKSSYTAKGQVSKFSLVKLNPLFIPISNIRIESGYLNSLTFDFAYIEFQSKGKLDIDYQDLKLLGLNKKNPKTNELKTFFIGLLVEKDRDQSGLHAKAVGIIDIERDRTRLIFNTWWKSVLDGLQSAILGSEKSKGVDKKS